MLTDRRERPLGLGVCECASASACACVCECVGQVVPARRQRGLGSPPGGSRAPPPPPPPPASLPLSVAVWAPARLPRSRRARPAFSEERSSTSPCRWEPGLRLPPHAAIPTRPPPPFPPLPPPPPSARPPSLPPSQQPPPLPPQALRSGDSRPPAAAASSSRKFELPQPPLTLRCGASAVGLRRGDSLGKVCPSFPSRHRLPAGRVSPFWVRSPDHLGGSPPRPLPSPPPLGPSWLRTPGPGARPGRAGDRLGRRWRGRPADPEPRGWGAAGAALPAARRDSPRYPEGQWRTAITIKRLALRAAKAVKPQRQPPLPPLATSTALSRSRVPSETRQSPASARRRPPSPWVAPSCGRSPGPFWCPELPGNTAPGPGGRFARTPHSSSPDVSIVWELFGEAGVGA